MAVTLRVNRTTRWSGGHGRRAPGASPRPARRPCWASSSKPGSTRVPCARRA